MSKFPQWQRENIELARAALDDDGSRFVALPDRFEIDEWSMMRRFAESQSGNTAADLLNAISGRGAFRYFKDRIHALGIERQWYAFRDDQYRQAALDWCRDNGIETDADE